MKTRCVQLSVLALAIVGTLVACSDSSSSNQESSVLPTRKIDAGTVEVTITPIQLDDNGAAFSISLDTHSGELSLDLTKSSVLKVDDTEWTFESWTGDGPDGHHRSGEIRFSARGPATGTAILTIAGLPEPMSATWELNGS